MRLGNALVAGFAATTTAFLIPSSIPEEIKDARFRGGPPEHFKEFIHHVLEQRTTNIDLACPACPFPVSQDDASTDGVVFDAEDVPNMIVSELPCSVFTH